MIAGVPQLVGGLGFWENFVLPEIEQLLKIRRVF
jgi:hypothetical protein